MLSERELIEMELSAAKRENIDWGIYDSQPIISASAAITRNQLIFFQNSVGTVGSDKSRTNMKNAGMMPSPESLLVLEAVCEIRNRDGICFQLDPSGKTYPLNLISATGWFEIKREPSVFYEGHLIELFPQATAGGWLGASQDELKTMRGTIRFKRPLILTTAVHFEITCTFDCPARLFGISSMTYMYWFLKGIKRRSP